MNRILISVAAALLLTGCASTSGTSTDETPRGANAPASSGAGEPEESTQETEETGTVTFGESFTWTDGLAVTVSKPKKFRPSEYASYDDEAKANLMFNFRVVNNTGEAFDMALFYVTMQSGNTEAEQIFDTDKELEGSPSTKLLDGRESEFKVGFSVMDPNDLVMEINPDSFTYESAIFTS